MARSNSFKKILFLALFLVFLSLPFFSFADDSLGQKKEFFIEPSYDINNRDKISATLRVSTNQIYFYVEDEWWDKFGTSKEAEIKSALISLSQFFQDKTYPILTSTFGSEWKPGIDKDNRIAVLFHSMKEEAAGYFKANDEYPKLQAQNSNEREMVYLNTKNIISPLSKIFLAHEFLHLITFNQKEKKYGVTEDTWLNEARAEYTPMLIGPDSDYQKSYLGERVNIFLDNPSDSLTEWNGGVADYGALNLFTYYLVEKYGVKILIDSLNSKETGIKSLDEVLIKNGFKDNFSRIFTDWTLAVFVNDCSFGEKYCYQNKSLKFIRVMPSINFLPFGSKSNLIVNQSTKDWSGNWVKFIGGKGILKIEFIGKSDKLFKIPYLLKDISGKYILNFLQLDENQKGEILIPGFLTEISSITLIPSAQSKTSGFSNTELETYFSWSASIVSEQELKEESDSIYLEKPLSSMTKEEISNKIVELVELINQLRSQLATLGTDKETESEVPVPFPCGRFEEDLSYGLIDSPKVNCLQEFLKSQGDDIYPEGLITGNFLSLTKSAVIRFQEKYADSILIPLGLKEGTGFVGVATRAKINELLQNKNF
ncbi:MAG: peptidoglycan-binding domain-containing protein [Candidatus Nealsonbacteria bacterium]|nr:peptidoglycan-binding domain-containing protein [Candidatus Nealsonbacteria bacterium]